MKLDETNATFLDRVAPDGGSWYHGAPFVSAQGIHFHCPLCNAHDIVVWFAGRGVPDGVEPKPRWNVSGSGLSDLTLTPSINLDVPELRVLSACRWHGFVTNGEAR
jgi:hypothetical protein